MIGLGKGAERDVVAWFRSRYACYLIAMTADHCGPLGMLFCLPLMEKPKSDKGECDKYPDRYSDESTDG